MKPETAKLELIEWLTRLDDKGILDSLLQFKKANEELDWADELTPSQRNRLEEGIEDYKAGRVVPSKKVWAKYGRKA